MYVCLCNGITDQQIIDAVNSGAESLRAVKRHLGVGTQCGQCKALARDIVRKTLEQFPSSGADEMFYVA